MVLGTVALPLSLFPPVIWVTGPVGIAAVVLGAIGRRQRSGGGDAGRTAAGFGIVLEAVSLVIAVALAAVWWAYTNLEVEFQQDGTKQVGSLAPAASGNGPFPASTAAHVR